MMAAAAAAVLEAAAETEAATEESLLAEAATEALETVALETVTTEAPETVEAAKAAGTGRKEVAKATGNLGLLTEAATDESLLAGQHKYHSIFDRLNFVYRHMATLHTPTWTTPPCPP
jgi:hypothetical protein